MPVRFIEDDEPRSRLRGTVLLSLATHAVCASLLLVGHGQKPLGAPKLPSWLGYKGQGHDARQLDLLQADAIRFRIFQPAVPGAGASGRTTRARLEAQKRSETVRPSPERTVAATADGARAARQAPVPQPTDAEGTGTSKSADQAGAPALQPDVALSEDLTIVKLVKPTYPERELAAGVSAWVWIAIHVARSGEIDELVVRRAEASPPGSTRAFELAALEALRQWRVRLPPGDQYDNGMWLTVPIEYSPTDADFDGIETVKPERASAPTL